VLSVFVQGYWLEGRKHAYAVESARLVVVLLITLAAPLLWPGFASVSELTLPLLAYVGAAGLALLAGRILFNSKNPLAQRA
jgi:hypothetical protein